MAQLIPYHISDTYSATQITGMDASGILFDDGQSIFFQECVMNFSRAYPESRSKCVAERNLYAPKPYFEFYTCGKSMIVQFDEPGRQGQKAFLDFQKRLESYGYTTYDLG